MYSVSQTNKRMKQSNCRPTHHDGGSGVKGHALYPLDEAISSMGLCVCVWWGCDEGDRGTCITGLRKREDKACQPWLTGEPLPTMRGPSWQGRALAWATKLSPPLLFIWTAWLCFDRWKITRRFLGKEWDCLGYNLTQLCVEMGQGAARLKN